MKIYLSVVITILIITSSKAPTTGYQVPEVYMIYASTEEGNEELYSLDMNTGQSSRLTFYPRDNYLQADLIDHGWLVIGEDINLREARFYRMDIEGNNKEYLFEDTGYDPYLPVSNYATLMIDNEVYIIVSAMKNGGNIDLIMHSLDSRHIEQLSATSLDEVFATVHPTQNWVYYTVEDQQGDTLYRVDPDGTSPEIVWRSEKKLIQFKWSNDGEWLFIVAENPDHTTDIFQISPDGEIVEQITHLEKRLLRPAISDDNQWLVFHVDGSPEVNIYKMNLASKIVTQLTYSERYNTFEAWISDTEFLFSEDKGVVERSIYKFNILTDKFECFVCNDRDDDFQTLSLDQEWVIFRQYPSGESDAQLFRKNIKNQTVEQLTFGAGDHSFEGWYIEK